MLLQSITERTWYLPGANNLGVVTTGAGGAIAIDTGLDKDTGRLLRKALDAAGLTLQAIISTHHHADHIGGNSYLLRNIPDIQVYAPPLEAALIEHPILEPIYLNHGASPTAALRTRWLLAQGTPVHQRIGDLERINKGDPFDLQVAGVSLEIIPLPGHSIAQVGVAYDGVCFAADGFFGPAVLARHGVPYAHDVAAQLASLERLAARCSPPCGRGDRGRDIWFLPGHGPLVACEDMPAMLASNRAAITQSSSSVLRALHQPGTLDVITGRVLRALGQELAGIPQYVIFAGAIAAHLTYLEQQGLVQAVLEEQGITWRSNVER